MTSITVELEVNQLKLKADNLFESPSPFLFSPSPDSCLGTKSTRAVTQFINLTVNDSHHFPKIIALSMASSLGLFHQTMYIVQATSVRAQKIKVNM